MSQSEIRAFVAVVRHHGFTAASRATGVPKATLSRQVATLEQRLSARLLHRTTRSVRPTDLGAAYYERVTAALDDLDEAAAAVRAEQTVPRGRVRITVPYQFGTLFMAEPTIGFLARYPEVEIELSLDDRMVDLVAEGFDAAVRASSRPLAGAGLVTRRLGGTRRVVVGSPSYLASRGRPRTPAELEDHEALLFAFQGSVWHFAGGESVSLRGRLTVNEGSLLREAAMAGLGLAVLPRFLVGADIGAGRLEEVLAETTEPEGSVWLVYPDRRPLPARVRALVDHLMAHFGPVPPWERCPSVPARRTGRNR